MSPHRYCPDCNCNVLEGVDKHQAWCPTGEAEAAANSDSDFYDEDAALCQCGHVMRDHASKSWNSSCCASIGHTTLMCSCTGFRGV